MTEGGGGKDTAKEDSPHGDGLEQSLSKAGPLEGLFDPVLSDCSYGGLFALALACWFPKTWCDLPRCIVNAKPTDLCGGGLATS
jgi:hypothetical protein